MAADAWRVWTGPSWLQRLSDVWGHASAWRIFWHHGPVGARSPSSPSARIPDRRIRGFNDCIESKAAVVAEPPSLPYLWGILRASSAGLMTETKRQGGPWPGTRRG